MNQAALNWAGNGTQAHTFVHLRLVTGDTLCPLTSKRKPYPFALPIKVDKVEGAVLVDQLKSLDWAGRQAQFHSKAEPALLTKVRQYISVLLGIR